MCNNLNIVVIINKINIRKSIPVLRFNTASTLCCIKFTWISVKATDTNVSPKTNISFHLYAFISGRDHLTEYRIQRLSMYFLAPFRFRVSILVNIDLNRKLNHVLKSLFTLHSFQTKNPLYKHTILCMHSGFLIFGINYFFYACWG